MAVIMSMSGVTMEEINPLARWYKAVVIRVQETCFSAYSSSSFYLVIFMLMVLFGKQFGNVCWELGLW